MKKQTTSTVHPELFSFFMFGMVGGIPAPNVTDSRKSSRTVVAQASNVFDRRPMKRAA